MNELDAGALPKHGGKMADGKVIRGKNGWLFLANDTNQIKRQLSGELALTEEQLERWREVLEHRIDLVESIGGRYFVFIVPEAHSIYPENLPEGYTISDERPLYQLEHHLIERDSRARLVNPIRPLLREKQHHLVYPQTDQHWSDRGAFVGYQELIEQIEKAVPVRRLREQDIDWTTEVRPGQLGNKFDPPESSLQVFGRVRGSRLRMVADNRVRARGAIVKLECDDAPDTTCVLLGDSMSYNMMFFLAHGFRRFFFGHVSTFDFDFVKEHEPDVVVSQMAERLLVKPMVDDPAWKVRDWEQRKLARKMLYPERGGWGLSNVHRRELYGRQLDAEHAGAAGA